MTRLLGANVYRVIPSIPPYGISPLLGYDLIGKMRKFGANTVKIYMTAHSYIDDAYGIVKNAMLKARVQAAGQGITFLMTGHGDITAPSETQSYVNKAAAIMNDGGAGDQWISDYVKIILELQPDGIEIMNEPPDASLGQHPQLTYAAYKTFIQKAATAYRAAKPNIILLVDSCPFWDLHSLASDPMNLINVLYCMHLHYLNPPPPATDPAYAFLNGYFTGGNLEAAKAEMETFIGTNEGLDACKAQGLPLLFSESGTRMDLPHWDSWLQNMFDIAKNNYGAGFLQHSFGANPPDFDAVLNSDWTTLNAMGMVWDANMQAPSRSVAARTVGPLGVPAAILRQMWRLRERVIRPAVHRKLHPLV